MIPCSFVDYIIAASTIPVAVPPGAMADTVTCSLGTIARRDRRSPSRPCLAIEYRGKIWAFIVTWTGCSNQKASTWGRILLEVVQSQLCGLRLVRPRLVNVSSLLTFYSRCQTDIQCKHF